MPAPASKVDRAEISRDTRVPRQRLAYAKEAAPVPEVPPRRRPQGARWVAPGIAGTAVVAAGSWLVFVPLIDSSSAERATTVADCVPQGDLFEVRVGMTRQAVLSSFSHAGHIEQYTPRQSLDVVHRSCARTAPWTRHLWITYAWQNGEWRVAELHKGLGIVAPD